MVAIVSVVMLVLFGLVMTGGIWVGVVVLGGAGKKASWWVMLTGVSVVTLGLAGYGVSYFQFMDNFAKRGPSMIVPATPAAPATASVFTSSSSSGRASGMNMGAAIAMGICMVAAGCGVVIFSAGFAMHGFRIARLVKRTAELETLCAAMAAAGAGANDAPPPVVPAPDFAGFEGFEG